MHSQPTAKRERDPGIRHRSDRVLGPQSHRESERVCARELRCRLDALVSFGREAPGTPMKDTAAHPHGRRAQRQAPSSANAEGLELTDSVRVGVILDRVMPPVGLGADDPVVARRGEYVSDAIDAGQLGLTFEQSAAGESQFKHLYIISCAGSTRRT
jgi:hypothetical protein